MISIIGDLEMAMGAWAEWETYSQIIDAAVAFERQWAPPISSTTWTTEHKPSDSSNAMQETKSLSNLRNNMARSAIPLLGMSLSRYLSA